MCDNASTSSSPNPGIRPCMFHGDSGCEYGHRQQLQMQSSSISSAVDVQSEVNEYENDIENLLYHFRNLELGENTMILSLLNRIKELRKQVNERKDWAHQKAMLKIGDLQQILMQTLDAQKVAVVCLLLIIVCMLLNSCFHATYCCLTHTISET